MKKILALTAIAAMVAGTANAIPTVTVTDSLGNTASASSADGVVTLTAKPLGLNGNWTINVDTGIGAPPAIGYPATASQPLLDLGMQNTFNQTAGGQLVGNTVTIDFTDFDLGPINGTLLDQVSSSLSTHNISAVFNVLVNGIIVASANGLNESFSAPVVAPAGSSVTLEAILTANASSAFISSDSLVTVPDSGMTLAMLALGMTGLVFFARTRKAA